MKNLISLRIFILLLLLIFFNIATLPKQACSETVGFDSNRWTILAGQVTEHLGRTAFEGIAVLGDVEFEDGIIEFDIAAITDREKSYPGIIFRIQGQNYERFYVRPHRSALYSDVLQYTPTINGVAGWQLYSGDGCTEKATIPVGQWIHMKMVIKGTQAQLFIDDNEKPALSISELKLGPRRGSIGVFGPAVGVSYFSNFSYTLDSTVQIDPIPIKEPVFGVIKNWELSEPVNRLEIDDEKTPDQLGLTELSWKSVESDPFGLVDICQHYTWNYFNANLVWAKTTINSSEDQLRKFSFGYSDAVNIFLNGQLIFSGVSTYQGRDPSFLGIIGLFDALYLPLKNGDNELIFAVMETFGGWGFMCQDADTVYLADGVTKVWEIENEVRMPESAVYDAEKDLLYITNYYNAGQEFISKITPDGHIQELKWITDLNKPTGLAMYKDKLYTVERTGLVEIDKESGQILNRFPIPNPGFPNDFTIDENGIGYLSDSDGNTIYKFANGELKIWLQSDDIISPNAIHYEKGRLLVGCTGDGILKSVDIETQKITPIVSLGAGALMDGITPDGRGNYIISDFYGRVFRVNSAGEKTPLINTNAIDRFTADITFIPEKNLLIVPRLYNSKLAAYTILP
ncbi:MAG: hypothetical protein V3V99_10280 [candidate division Zixibacteria bacterium]